MTCLSFARGLRTLLALGSADGSISICQCVESPSVEKVLDARSGPISRFVLMKLKATIKTFRNKIGMECQQRVHGDRLANRFVGKAYSLAG